MAQREYEEQEPLYTRCGPRRRVEARRTSRRACPAPVSPASSPDVDRHDVHVIATAKLNDINPQAWLAAYLPGSPITLPRGSPSSSPATGRCATITPPSLCRSGMDKGRRAN